MELPHHLAKSAAQGLIENEAIAQFEIGEARNFIYLILDWATREAALVDPQFDLAPPLDALKKHRFKLTRVLLTHTHWDHIEGLPEVAQRFPHLSIGLHSAEMHRLSEALQQSPQLQSLQDNQVIQLGNTEIHILHTPGHSAGECCYLVKAPDRPYLLSGDTLFIRDCGRTDLPTSDTQAMFHSLQQIKTLPPETVILPGHHYQPETASTLAKELIESPPLRCKTITELANLP